MIIYSRVNSIWFADKIRGDKYFRMRFILTTLTTDNKILASSEQIQARKGDKKTIRTDSRWF